VHRAKISAKFQMAIHLMPFGQRTQIPIRPMRENRIAQIEQIDTAIKLARANLRSPMRPFGDQLHAPVCAREQRENLRCLTVFHFAQANASIADQRHSRDDTLARTAEKVATKARRTRRIHEEKTDL
jgi:hypothetical protein